MAGIYKAWNSAMVIGLLVAYVVAVITFAISQYLQGGYTLLVSQLLRQRIVAIGIAYSFFYKGAFYLLLYYVLIYS